MAELIYAGDGGVFKICGTCRETKFVSEFTRRKSAIDGLRNACKACENAPRRDGEPIGATIQCERCRVDMVKTGPGLRFCNDCVRERNNERTLSAYYQKKESLGVIPIGSTIQCVDCGTGIIRAASKVTRCAGCYKFRRDNRRYLESGREPGHKPRGEMIVCEICRIEFPRKGANQKFCGKDCYQESLRRARKEKASAIDGVPNRTCSNCGVKFYHGKTGPAKYCEPCREEVRAEQSREISRNFAYRNGSKPSGTIVQCEWCDSNFPSRKGGNRFCSTTCRKQSWLANRWRKRLTGAVRVPGQIILCEWCNETYEYKDGADNSRCYQCVESGASPSIRQLWEKYEERRTEAGITERKRKYFRHYHDRRREDPRHKLDERMSGAIRQSLARGKGGVSWKKMVPYTVEELKASLERQFQPGMSWDNYGEWHIDHRVPISAHSYETPDDPDFKACWAITNLQPLWAEDNIRKGSKRLYLV